MKIAINKCFGGFSVSREVVDRLRAKGHMIVVDGEFYSDGSGPRKLGDSWGYHLSNEDFGIESSDNYNEYRSHPDLIEAIEQSSSPNTTGSEIKIVEIPDDVEFVIDEYNGLESVHEKHRVWG